MDDKKFLKKFGLSDEMISKVIFIKSKDNYYWSAEGEGDKVIINCAFSRNDLYHGKDITLAEKITTRKELFIRSGELDYTIVMEEFINKNDLEETIYIVTALKDQMCMYEENVDEKIVFSGNLT